MASRTFVSRFSPNRTDPTVLEAIFVQRHKLVDVWLERLRDSILTGVKHHMLAVGPRGCGKSHLVALLISRLRKDSTVTERVRIAWLPEDETTPSFWKFLLRILRALNAEYKGAFPPLIRDELADASDDRRSSLLTDYLLKKLDGRTLLVVVENLDDVMRGLKSEGQKRWRAFLQEHPVAATLATAQQLTEDLSDRDRPFFNFFQIEHLLPLSAAEALDLLRRIAIHTGNTDLNAFLQTAAGRARVRAIRHLAGGSHRVFIILSEFATREKLDDLVTAFEELLDELTPYYQERLRWLPDQQREIVEFLCRQARTVPVKEIAGELFLTEQTAAAQLKGLKDKGYVMAESVGRESRYELAEPLMRLCVEVKDPRKEPIRLVVEFLRIWYDRERFDLLCDQFDRHGDLGKYIDAVSCDYERECMSPVEAALIRDLELAQQCRDSEQVLRIAEEIVATSGVQPCLHAGFSLLIVKREIEALAVFARVCELVPEDFIGWFGQCLAFKALGRKNETLQAIGQASEVKPTEFGVWMLKGLLSEEYGRHEEALEAFDQIIKFRPDSADTWNNKAFVLNTLGRHEEALAACEQAIELKGNYSYPWCNLGRAKIGLGRIQEALDDLRHSIEFDANLSNALEALAEAHTVAGDWEEAERAIAKRLQLPPSEHNSNRFWHLPDIILAIFRASPSRSVWGYRVGRLADIAAKEKAHRPPSDPRPNPLAALGNSLVRTLTMTAYTEALADALTAWVDVWQEVAERHSGLSLAVRLFSVGVRYVRMKDERTLLDLVQEERAILRDLFGLDDVSI